MKQLSKRLFGALLAIIMAVTMLPNSTFKATAANASTQRTITTGSTFFYGSYPQTKVTNPALITALNALTLSSDDTVTYAGSKYKRVYFTQYTPQEVGTSISPDESYQAANSYYINTVYWFKYEPIKWRVLSNTSGELFVMAENILASSAYNQADNNVTWETCDLRHWLNNDFYNTAFNSSEKAGIKTTAVVNEDNPWDNSDGGNNTSDKLFLPSLSEATNTANSFSSDESTDTSRQAQGTDYSKSQGLYVYTGSTYLGNGFWWLRTPGDGQSCACIVCCGGDIDSDGDGVITTYIGVRPAFKINLSSVIFVSSISLSKSSATLLSGKTLQLTATVKPSNAIYKAVAWKSSSSAALVSAAGLVTANAVGAATITCSALDGSGIKATCKITVIPKTPTNLKAVKATTTSIKLTWTAVSGATGYYIYRSNSSSGPYTKIKALTGSNTFTNTGLITKGMTYYYKVQAYKTVGANLYAGGLSSMAYAKV